MPCIYNAGTHLIGSDFHFEMRLAIANQRKAPFFISVDLVF